MQWFMLNRPKLKLTWSLTGFPPWSLVQLEAPWLGIQPRCIVYMVCLYPCASHSPRFTDMTYVVWPWCDCNLPCRTGKGVRASSFTYDEPGMERSFSSSSFSFPCSSSSCSGSFIGGLAYTVDRATATDTAGPTRWCKEINETALDYTYDTLSPP